MALEVETVVAAFVIDLACLDLADAVEQQTIATVIAESTGVSRPRLEHHHVLHVQAGFQVVAGRYSFDQGVTAGNAAQLGKLAGQVHFQVRGVDVQTTGFNQGQQQRQQTMLFTFVAAVATVTRAARGGATKITDQAQGGIRGSQAAGRISGSSARLASRSSLMKAQSGA